MTAREEQIKQCKNDISLLQEQLKKLELESIEKVVLFHGDKILNVGTYNMLIKKGELDYSIQLRRGTDVANATIFVLKGDLLKIADAIKEITGD